MPISNLTLTDFNAFPLPDISLFPYLAASSFGYGSVIGSDPLAAADGDSSYIRLNTFGSGVASAITCRPVLSPDPPSSWIPEPGLTSIEADFRAVQTQFRFESAPPAYPISMVNPHFIIANEVGELVFISLDEGRDLSGAPPWSDTWWDQTNCGTFGLPPVFSVGNKGFVNPGLIRVAETSGYLVIAATATVGGYPLHVSQLIGQITWITGEDTWHTVGGHFATVGGATPQILTPGVGWVDLVDGPA